MGCFGSAGATSVVALRGMVAALIAAAACVVCGHSRSAAAGEAENSSLLVFSGTDLWRYGAFLYGGTVWAPTGLDSGSGFSLKTLLSTGDYSYLSGGGSQDIDGELFSAAILPGWHFNRSGLSIGLFAGPTVQNYQLSPNDPGARLSGAYVGADFAADVWYQPNAAIMMAFNGAIASIGPTGYVHVALGERVFGQAFAGPEMQAIWSGNYQELQVGAQLTGLQVNTLQWTAGGGWALGTMQRSSPYLHVGISWRR